MKEVKFRDLLEAWEIRCKDLFDDLDLSDTTLPIETLIKARMYYVHLKEYYNELIGGAKREMRIAELNRKIEEAELKNKYKEEHSGERGVVSNAEVYAELNSKEAKLAEFDAEEFYETTKARRDSLGEKISAIAQVIGVMRQELEQTQFQRNNRSNA